MCRRHSPETGEGNEGRYSGFNPISFAPGTRERTFCRKAHRNKWHSDAFFNSMDTPLRTTYLGYQISIEPSEWGYLAHIVEPVSKKHFIAANASALRALEDAFEVIDENVSLADGADDAVPTSTVEGAAV